ncbi:MAG TPA: beta-propeller domain-containing protein [Acidimicrobiales bacterium]|nr:beta-propeller domain-containing protein [Acidimicrobiales bacterium]
MDNGLNPGNRPRKGAALLLGALALFAVVAAAAVVATPERAEAVGLEPFTSCRELSTWGDEVSDRWRDGLVVYDAAPTASADGAAESDSGGAGSVGAPASTMATERTQSAGFAADEKALDATNVVVDGVDELDLVDRLGDDRVLVVAGSKLAIVDLAGPTVLATRPVAYGAQVTFDRERGRAWVVDSADGNRVVVTRIDVGADSLDAAGTWSTPGQLVDARRIGGRLHLVASDGFGLGGGPQELPFGGEAVPCDRVLHPDGPSRPAASLIVTLPVTGELEPEQATEVVGSGQLVHVTDTAAYLATPQWNQDGAASTAIHRFDIGTLEHTGSGSVPGSLLNDFSMSEHDGHLRVAITADGGGVVGRPMPVDDMPGTFVEEGDSGAPARTDGSAGTMGGGDGTSRTVEEVVPVEPAAPDVDGAVPQTTVPADPTTSTTSTTEVPATTSTSTSTTSTSTSTTTSTSTSTTTTTEPAAGATIPGPGPGDPFNKVVVLDTVGNLDVVGSTPWFGHPGETLHGIRFDGDTAYAVTFLQTDPFYVLDLADPQSPKVAGEVELPGFSAYLHPVGEGRVVGFGPGESGRQEVKLFDVSNPAAPKVLEELVLGDDSPVTYDHHAFVSLGEGRFAVPVTSYAAMTTDCAIPGDVGPATDDAGCAPEPSGVQSQVVELRVVGDRLDEVDRLTVELPEPASRAIPTADGWALLAGSSIGTIADDGTQGTTVTI